MTRDFLYSVKLGNGRARSVTLSSVNSEHANSSSNNSNRSEPIQLNSVFFSKLFTTRSTSHCTNINTTNNTNNHREDTLSSSTNPPHTMMDQPNLNQRTTIDTNKHDDTGDRSDSIVHDEIIMENVNDELDDSNAKKDDEDEDENENITTISPLQEGTESIKSVPSEIFMPYGFAEQPWRLKSSSFLRPTQQQQQQQQFPNHNVQSVFPKARPRINSRDINNHNKQELLENLKPICPTIFSVTYIIILTVLYVVVLFLYSLMEYPSNSTTTVTTCLKDDVTNTCDAVPWLSMNGMMNLTATDYQSYYETNQYTKSFFSLLQSMINFWKIVKISEVTVLNGINLFITMSYIHWTKGQDSFLFIAGYIKDTQGDLDDMTVWEQLEALQNGDQSFIASRIKSVLLIVPTILTLLACITSDYQYEACCVNLFILSICFLAKLPCMQGVRFLGINETPGFDDPFFQN